MGMAMVWLFHAVLAAAAALPVIHSTRLSLNIITTHQRSEEGFLYKPQFDYFKSEDEENQELDCLIQFVGYIETTLDQEIYWISGAGVLSLETSSTEKKIFSGNCSYISVTGVEANHQMVSSLHTFPTPHHPLFFRTPLTR